MKFRNRSLKSRLIRPIAEATAIKPFAPSDQQTKKQQNAYEQHIQRGFNPIRLPDGEYQQCYRNLVHFIQALRQFRQRATIRYRGCEIRTPRPPPSSRDGKRHRLHFVIHSLRSHHFIILIDKQHWLIHGRKWHLERPGLSS